MEGGGWKVEIGGWRVEGGGWRVEGGGWRLEGGGWRVEGGFIPARAPCVHPEREIFIDNLPVRVHLIIEMSRPAVRHVFRS